MKRRGIQAIRHITVANGSDHDAVLVTLRIVHDSQYVVVNGGTWNIGNGTMDDLRYLLNALGPRGFLCLQEAGGQLQRIRATARALGWRVGGDTRQPGAASTIVLLGPGLKSRGTRVRRLLARTYVGQGAGPSHNKAKYANGELVHCDGITFGVSSAHELASLQHDLRMEHGLTWARRLTDFVSDRRAMWIVGADFNDELDDDRGLSEVMAGWGWTNNHEQLGALDTHGHRSIDALAWRVEDNIPPAPDTKENPS